MHRLALLMSVLGTLAAAAPAQMSAQDRPLDQVRALVEKAQASGLARTARKTKPVDARPAKPGEVVVTTIAGEGKETQSPPAKPGDWVVRNRCPATGNEQYLVDGKKFPGRYERTATPPGGDGWEEYRPVGKAMRFIVLTAADGEFTFTAPWGERMVAKPGDAIVQDPDNPGDTYRVAAASFACTYEVVEGLSTAAPPR
jgi:hypothetical protein